MAGQRGYYSNVLTNTKGQVEAEAKIQINGAAGATGTRVLVGRMVAIASVSSLAGGTNNAVTLQMPEKYGSCCRLNATMVLTSATDVREALITSDYNPTTGQVTFMIGVNNGTTIAGSTSPNVTVYFDAAFELGA